MRFPDVRDAASFDAFMDEGPVQAVLDELAHALGTGPLIRPKRGSVLVGLAEAEVVKVFAPHDAGEAEIEAACLRALQGRLPIPTPTLTADGALEGWRWLRMSRLAGEELTEAWPTFTPAEHESLAAQLGEGLATLHRLEAPPKVPRVDWTAWREDRLATLVEVQRGKGCPAPLLEGLEGFVRGADLSAGEAAWLHTEVMREHLLVERTSRGPRLSGLFDFEPSWVAPVDYEFASVGIFFSAKDPRLLHEVLRAAGRRVDPRRLFAFAALHRYANLAWYHERLGGPAELDRLAEAWFGQSFRPS